MSVTAMRLPGLARREASPARSDAASLVAFLVDSAIKRHRRLFGA